MNHQPLRDAIDLKSSAQSEFQFIHDVKVIGYNHFSSFMIKSQDILAWSLYNEVGTAVFKAHPEVIGGIALLLETNHCVFTFCWP